MTDMTSPAGAIPAPAQTEADDGFPTHRPQPGVIRQTLLHWLLFLGGTAALLGGAAWLL